MEQFVDQTALSGVARDGRLEDVRTTNLLRAPDGALGFEPVHERLYGRVRPPGLCGQRVLDLTDRGRAPAPQAFHDFMLCATKLWSAHNSPTTVVVKATTCG